MERSEFVFDSIDLLYCKLHKILLNWGGSYEDSLRWLKKKETTTNPKNSDDKCFQYAITLLLKKCKE